jgi:hypothetical protein
MHRLKEQLVLAEVERLFEEKLYTLRHLYYSVNSVDLKNGAPKAYSKEANISYKDIGKLLMPYIEWDKDNSSTIKEDVDLEHLKAVWEAAFGKMDSPENKKMLDELKSGKPATELKREDMASGVQLQ